MVNWIIWIVYVSLIAWCICYQLCQFFDWFAAKAHRRNNIWYINQMRELEGEEPLETDGMSDYEIRSKAEEIQRFSKLRAKARASR